MGKEEEFDMRQIEMMVEGNNDLDFGAPDMGDARKPASPTKEYLSEALEGANRELRKGVERKLEKELPDSAEIVSQAYDLKDDLVDIKDSVEDALEPITKSVKAGVRSTMPLFKMVLPDSWVDKLKEMTEKEPRGQSAEEIKQKNREDQLNGAIGEIFNQNLSTAQMVKDTAEATMAKAEKDKAEAREEKIEDRAAAKAAHIQSVTATTGVIRELKLQNVVSAKLEQPWMKKMLELQFRHLYVSQDMLGSINSMLKLQEGSFKEIVKNTGLPDMQKVRQTEAFTHKLKGAAVDKLQNQVQTMLSDATKKLKTKVLETVKSTGSIVSDTLDQLGMVADMAGDEGDDMFGPKSNLNFVQKQLAQAIGGAISSAMTGGATGMLLKKYAPLVKSIEKSSKNGVDKLMGKIMSAKLNANSEMTDSWKQVFFDLFPSAKPNQAIDNMFDRSGGLDPTAFDNGSRQALVEVIPAWLGKIHQSVETSNLILKDGLGYNGPNAKEFVYDEDTRDFMSTDTWRDRQLDRMFGDESHRGANYDRGVGTIAAALEVNAKDAGGGSLSSETKADIKKFYNNVALSNADIEWSDIRDFVYPPEDYEPSGWIMMAKKDIANPRTLFSKLLLAVSKPDGTIDIDATNAIFDNVIAIRGDERHKDKLQRDLNIRGHKRLMNDVLFKDKYGEITDVLEGSRVFDIVKNSSKEAREKNEKSAFVGTYVDLSAAQRDEDSIIPKLMDMDESGSLHVAMYKLSQAGIPILSPLAESLTVEDYDYGSEEGSLGSVGSEYIKGAWNKLTDKLADKYNTAKDKAKLLTMITAIATGQEDALSDVDRASKDYHKFMKMREEGTLNQYLMDITKSHTYDKAKKAVDSGLGKVAAKYAEMAPDAMLKAQRDYLSKHQDLDKTTLIDRSGKVGFDNMTAIIKNGATIAMNKLDNMADGVDAALNGKDEDDEGLISAAEASLEDFLDDKDSEIGKLTGKLQKALFTDENGVEAQGILNKLVAASKKVKNVNLTSKFEGMLKDLISDEDIKTDDEVAIEQAMRDAGIAEELPMPKRSTRDNDTQYGKKVTAVQEYNENLKKQKQEVIDKYYADKKAVEQAKRKKDKESAESLTETLFSKLSDDGSSLILDKDTSVPTDIAPSENIFKSNENPIVTAIEECCDRMVKGLENIILNDNKFNKIHAKLLTHIIEANMLPQYDVAARNTLGKKVASTTSELDDYTSDIAEIEKLGFIGLDDNNIMARGFGVASKNEVLAAHETANKMEADNKLSALQEAADSINKFADVQIEAAKVNELFDKQKLAEEMNKLADKQIEASNMNDEWNADHNEFTRRGRAQAKVRARLDAEKAEREERERREAMTPLQKEIQKKKDLQKRLDEIDHFEDIAEEYNDYIFFNLPDKTDETNPLTRIMNSIEAAGVNIVQDEDLVKATYESTGRAYNGRATAFATDNNGKKSIVINDAVETFDPETQAAILAHELGHIVLGHLKGKHGLVDNPEFEKEANNYAADRGYNVDDALAEVKNRVDDEALGDPNNDGGGFKKFVGGIADTIKDRATAAYNEFDSKEFGKKVGETLSKGVDSAKSFGKSVGEATSAAVNTFATNSQQPAYSGMYTPGMGMMANAPSYREATGSGISSSFEKTYKEYAGEQIRLLGEINTKGSLFGKIGGMLSGVAGGIGSGLKWAGGKYVDMTGNLMKGAGSAASGLFNMLGNAASPVGNVLSSALGGIGTAAGGYFKGVGNATGGLFKGIGNAFGSLRGKKIEIKAPTYFDVYRVDKIDPGKPLITARQQREGTVVFSKGQTIKATNDITEPVFDIHTKEALITSRDIEVGLCDVDGKKLGSSDTTIIKRGGLFSGLANLGSKALGFGSSALDFLNPFGKMYTDLATSALKGLGTMGKDALGGLGNWVLGKNKGGGANIEVVKRLDMIYKLLDVRLVPVPASDKWQGSVSRSSKSIDLKKPESDLRAAPDLEPVEKRSLFSRVKDRINDLIDSYNSKEDDEDEPDEYDEDVYEEPDEEPVVDKKKSSKKSKKKSSKESKKEESSKESKKKESKEKDTKKAPQKPKNIVAHAKLNIPERKMPKEEDVESSDGGTSLMEMFLMQKLMGSRVGQFFSNKATVLKDKAIGLATSAKNKAKYGLSTAGAYLTGEAQLSKHEETIKQDLMRQGMPEDMAIERAQAKRRERNKGFKQKVKAGWDAGKRKGEARMLQQQQDGTHKVTNLMSSIDNAKANAVNKAKQKAAETKAHLKEVADAKTKAVKESDAVRRVTEFKNKQMEKVEATKIKGKEKLAKLKAKGADKVSKLKKSKVGKKMSGAKKKLGSFGKKAKGKIGRLGSRAKGMGGKVLGKAGNALGKAGKALGVIGAAAGTAAGAMSAYNSFEEGDYLGTAMSVGETALSGGLLISQLGGTEVIASALGTAGSTIATGVSSAFAGMGGTAALSALAAAAAPVVAVAAIATGAYMAFNATRNSDLFKKLADKRMTYYGIQKTSDYEAFENLEDRAYNILVGRWYTSSAEIERPEAIEIAKTFGVKLETEDNFANFVRWFEGRFKPIFKCYMKGLEINGIDYDDTDDMTEEDLNEDPDLAKRWGLAYQYLGNNASNCGADLSMSLTQKWIDGNDKKKAAEEAKKKKKDKKKGELKKGPDTIKAEKNIKKLKKKIRWRKGETKKEFELRTKATLMDAGLSGDALDKKLKKMLEQWDTIENGEKALKKEKEKKSGSKGKPKTTEDKAVAGAKTADGKTPKSLAETATAVGASPDVVSAAGALDGAKDDKKKSILAGLAGMATIGMAGKATTQIATANLVSMGSIGKALLKFSPLGMFGLFDDNAKDELQDKLEDALDIAPTKDLRDQIKNALATLESQVDTNEDIATFKKGLSKEVLNLMEGKAPEDNTPSANGKVTSSTKKKKESRFDIVAGDMIADAYEAAEYDMAKNGDPSIYTERDVYIDIVLYGGSMEDIDEDISTIAERMQNAITYMRLFGREENKDLHIYHGIRGKNRDYYTGKIPNTDINRLKLYLGWRDGEKKEVFLSRYMKRFTDLSASEARNKKSIASLKWDLIAEVDKRKAKAAEDKKKGVSGDRMELTPDKIPGNDDNARVIDDIANGGKGRPKTIAPGSIGGKTIPGKSTVGMTAVERMKLAAKGKSKDPLANALGGTLMASGRIGSHKKSPAGVSPSSGALATGEKPKVVSLKPSDLKPKVVTVKQPKIDMSELKDSLKAIANNTGALHNMDASLKANLDKPNQIINNNSTITSVNGGKPKVTKKKETIKPKVNNRRG